MTRAKDRKNSSSLKNSRSTSKFKLRSFSPSNERRIKISRRCLDWLLQLEKAKSICLEGKWEIEIKNGNFISDLCRPPPEIPITQPTPLLILLFLIPLTSPYNLFIYFPLLIVNICIRVYVFCRSSYKFTDVNVDCRLRRSKGCMNSAKARIQKNWWLECTHT